jgi:hypothetical protein
MAGHPFAGGVAPVLRWQVNIPTSYRIFVLFVSPIVGAGESFKLKDFGIHFGRAG